MKNLRLKKKLIGDVIPEKCIMEEFDDSSTMRK